MNEHGGIRALGGAKLEVLPADTTSDDPATAASITRHLINQDKVSVLVGAHTSTMTLSVQIEAERGEEPLITTSHSDQLIQRGLKYTFKLTPQVSTLSQEALDDILALFQQIKNKKVTRIAVLYGADASAQVVSKVLLELAKSKAWRWWRRRPSLPISRTRPAWSARCSLPSRRCSTSTPMCLITRALRSLSVTIPIAGAGSGMSVKTLGSTLGKQGDNLIGMLAWNRDLQTGRSSRRPCRERAAETRRSCATPLRRRTCRPSCRAAP